MCCRECNKQGEVLEVVCEFYAGLYLLLYQIWKGQGKTISDSGFVIKGRFVSNTYFGKKYLRELGLTPFTLGICVRIDNMEM